MIINSVSNKKVVFLKKLQLKKYRDENQLFIVEGEHAVYEAFKNKFLKEVYIVLDNDYEYDVEKYYVTLEIMKKITMLENPPLIVGVCEKKEDDIKGNKIVLLDNIQDPGNLGTIIRSAVAFNIETIILSEKTVDLYNSKVLRSAQGLNFCVNIVRKNLIDEINKLKEKGFYIYATDLKSSNEIEKVKFKKKIAIVIGNEGSGVSKDILNICDENIYIKMNQNCESLNAGVAAGIIFYKLDK